MTAIGFDEIKKGVVDLHGSIKIFSANHPLLAIGYSAAIKIASLKVWFILGIVGKIIAAYLTVGSFLLLDIAIFMSYAAVKKNLPIDIEKIQKILEKVIISYRRTKVVMRITKEIEITADSFDMRPVEGSSSTSVVPKNA